MITDITIGQYYKGDSFIHKLDARAKIILTIFVIALIFLCKNFISLAVTLLLVIISVILSSVPFKMYLKSLKPILPIVLFTAVLNLFYAGGENVIFSFGKLFSRNYERFQKEKTPKLLWDILLKAVSPRRACLNIC